MKLTKLILVAPYWNLNFKSLLKRFKLFKHISSSILEFKCQKKSQRRESRIILVAPYWNLNKDSIKINNKYYPILVAPYWNLNI